MNLGPINKTTISIAIDYLSRMEFILFPDTDYERVRLIERISDTFSTNPESVYNLLLNYTVENNQLGHKITIDQLNTYLASKQVYKYNLSNDSHVWPRINILNEEFESSFIPIDHAIIHRQEVEEIYSHIMSNQSIILQGKAGAGKSGCIQELIQELKKDGIPYLALKLDKRIPEKSAKQYGINILDLPASPVLCLSHLSQNGNCVLILDQLDAIRWTSQHSRTSLEVCKELISQAERLNSDLSSQSKMSLVFVCRAVDCEADSGIKSLFSDKGSDKNAMSWIKIKVGDLNEESVKGVVGNLYSTFTPKFQLLLRNINNLYIWSKLDDEHKRIQYASTYHLVQAYWEQFTNRCDDQEISSSDIAKLKDTLIGKMLSSSRTSILKTELRECSPRAISMAISEGIIIENDLLVFFVHQSFYDVFVVETMVDELYRGKKLSVLLGQPNKQTPMFRYQLQMLLQILAESDQSVLAKCGSELLHSANVRYYMKFVFFEVVGQLTKIEPTLMQFIEELIQEKKWFYPIINTILLGHPHYIQHFINNGLISSWVKSTQQNIALGLLRSVSMDLGDQIVDLLIPYAFQSSEMDIKIYGTLCSNIEDDTDSMFDFRLNLIKHNPNFLSNYINFKSLAKNNLGRAEKLLSIIFEVDDHATKQNIGKYIGSDFDIFEYLGKEDPIYVWNSFLPLIEDETENAKINQALYLHGWDAGDVQPTLGRGIVLMAIIAGKQLAEEQPEVYFDYFQRYANSESSVVNEILLYTIIKLPESYSDKIIKWLISESCIHMFDRSGEYKKELQAARLLLEKYSYTCSETEFHLLEQTITQYHRKDELEIAQRRYKNNRAVRANKIDSHYCGDVYWPYWGEFQAYLLPALDLERTSPQTKQLICVLNRRFEGNILGVEKSRIASGWVGPSINQVIAKKFSNKQWLRLIRNRKLNSKEFLQKNVYRSDFLQSSPWQFANLYSQVGMTDPQRFVALALQFPADVDTQYVQAVMSIASKTSAPEGVEDWVQAEFAIIQQMVNLFNVC